jgi:serine/threonine-protein kinase
VSTNYGEVTVSPGELKPGTQVGRWLKLALHARDGRTEREVALMKATQGIFTK